jgi:septal ring factor EnvC (AmiA/AmiB activator)
MDKLILETIKLINPVQTGLIFMLGFSFYNLLKQQINGQGQRLDNEIKGLRDEVKDEIKYIRKEIKDLKDEIKDLREDIKATNSKLDTFLLTLFKGNIYPPKEENKDIA